MSGFIHIICIISGFIVGVGFCIYVEKKVWTKPIKIIDQKSANADWVLISIVTTSILIAFIALSAFVLPLWVEQSVTKNGGEDTVFAILLNGGFFAPMVALLIRIVVRGCIRSRKMQDTDLYNEKLLTPFLLTILFVASVTVMSIGLINLDKEGGAELATKGVLWCSLCIGTYIGFATEFIDRTLKEQLFSIIEKIKALFAEKDNKKRAALVFIPSIAMGGFLFLTYYVKIVETIIIFCVIPAVMMGLVPMIIFAIKAGYSEGRGKAFKSKRKADVSVALTKANGKKYFYDGMQYSISKMDNEGKTIRVYVYPRDIEDKEKYDLSSWDEQKKDFSISDFTYSKVDEFLEDILIKRKEELEKVRDEIRQAKMQRGTKLSE